MKQLMFLEPGVFEWHEVPMPRLTSDTQALVKPLAVTRCDLDLYIANGAFPMKGPFAFGHEIAGEVIDVGDKVTNVSPGDRVIVPFQISCGHCSQCLRGHTNACESVPQFSAYGLAPSSGQDWGGGLSDLILVPFANAMLVPIPYGLSLVDAAAMSDNAIDGYRTVAEPLQKYPGTPVLVVGGLAQSVGLYAAKAALALGASRVEYRDFDERRLAAAISLGADALMTSYDTDGSANGEFFVTVEASGTPKGLTYALRATAPCGICTSVSAGTGSIANVPLREMYMKGIEYNVGRVHARGALTNLIQSNICHSFCAHDLIDRTIPFSQAGETMADPNIKTVYLADEAETISEATDSKISSKLN